MDKKVDVAADGQEALLPAVETRSLAVRGWCTKTISTSSQAVLYTSKSHGWRYAVWDQTLYAGSDRSQPVLFMSRRGMRLMSPTVKIYDADREPITKLANANRNPFLVKRLFTLNNREYVWQKAKHLGPGWNIRFVLVDAKSGVKVADYEFSRCSSKATLIFYEAASNLPTEVLVGTALAVEAICRRQKLARLLTPVNPRL